MFIYDELYIRLIIVYFSFFSYIHKHVYIVLTLALILTHMFGMRLAPCHDYKKESRHIYLFIYLLLSFVFTYTKHCAHPCIDTHANVGNATCYVTRHIFIYYYCWCSRNKFLLMRGNSTLAPETPQTCLRWIRPRCLHWVVSITHMKHNSQFC